MDELISRIVAATGIDEGMANNAISIILTFLNKEGPEDKMQMVLDMLPGAADMIKDDSGGGGLLGGLGGMIPGMGAMGAINELTSAGLGMGEIKTVAKELLDFAREKAGDEVVDDVISQIPMLNQVL